MDLHLCYQALLAFWSASLTKPSPSCLQWQCGDAFDFSIGLCSLLLGAGFDAYCVAGYAPKEVTTNDQSNVECPLLNDQVSDVISKIS